MKHDQIIQDLNIKYKEKRERDKWLKLYALRLE